MENNRIVLTDEDILFSFFTMHYDSDSTELERQLLEVLKDDGLAKNAKKALMNNWTKLRTYALIKVENTYCWIKHDGQTLQDNVYTNEVYPFSSTQVYPKQKIKKYLMFI